MAAPWEKYQSAPAAEVAPWMKYQAAPAEESYGQKALGLLGKAANKIDSYTGAPMRAGIGAAQDADQPGDIPAVAFEAAKKQFGADPALAPTGKDIVKKAGVSDQDIELTTFGGGKVKMNPAGIAGFGMDVAANPLNFVGPAASLAGKAARTGGVALPAAADLASGAAKGLESFAHEKAVKAAGAMAKDFRMIKDKGMMDSLGSYLLDNKLVTPLSSVSKVAKNLEEAKDVAGKTIGHILDTSDAAMAPKISAREIALQLSEDPEIAGLAKIPGKEGTASQISNYLNTLYKNGEELSLRDAQRLRQGIDESINFNKRVPDMAGAQPYLYKMRDALSQKMNEAVNSLDLAEGEESINRLREANQAYSKLATLERIAQNRVGALSANRAVSLTDTMAGLAGAGMAHGSHSGAKTAAVGAAAALANKAARTYGNSVMATGARALAPAVEAAPGLISEGAAPAAAAQGLLLNRKKK